MTRVLFDHRNDGNVDVDSSDIVYRSCQDNKSKNEKPDRYSRRLVHRMVTLVVMTEVKGSTVVGRYGHLCVQNGRSVIDGLLDQLFHE